MLKNKIKFFRLSLVLQIALIIFLAFSLVLGNEIRLGFKRYMRNTIEADASSTIQSLDNFSRNYINLSAQTKIDYTSESFEKIYQNALGGNYQLIKSLVTPDGKITDLSREAQDETILCVLLDEYKENTDWPVYIHLDSIGNKNIEKLEDYFIQNKDSQKISLEVVISDSDENDLYNYVDVQIGKISVDGHTIVDTHLNGNVEKLTGRLSLFSNMYKEIYFSNNTQTLSYGSYSHAISENRETVILDYEDAIMGVQDRLQNHFDEFVNINDIYSSTAYADYYLLDTYKYGGKHYSSVLVKLIDWGYYKDLYNLSEDNKMSDEDKYEQSIGRYLIVTREYENLVQDSVRQFLKDNYSTYCLAFILIVFMCLLLSYMIVRPIHRLQLIAKHIARKDFDYPINTSGIDEFGDLSRSMDKMKTELQKTINNLYGEIEKVKQLENIRKEFVSMFTHEIKTPLGIINGFSELVEIEEDAEKRNQYIDIIQDEIKKINNLVLAMLEYSKLESQNVVLKKEDFNLAEVVEEVLESMSCLFENKTIPLDVVLKPEMIYADRFRIEMVVSNLISNAYRYTQNGKIIHILLDDGLFSIENEGAHIPDEDIEKVWLTFHKVDKARNEQGTGLGLAICRAVLDLHKYEYGVKNTERGVLFYFRFDRSER